MDSFLEPEGISFLVCSVKFKTVRSSGKDFIDLNHRILKLKVTLKNNSLTVIW